MRVVSLLPSATEIVCAVGAEDTLVGISHECDHPAAITDRPVLTRSRIDADGTSREIDERVRAAIPEALSIYAVDEAKLAALEPDVIVTQDLCEVCAVSLDDVRSALARMAHREDLEIVSLRPTMLAHVLDDVVRVGEALGRAEAGREARAALEARIQAIASRAAELPRRRVVTIEWIDPIMLGGTWMPELIELAGGIAAGATAGEPAPTVTPEALGELAPDVVLVKPCGFDVERTLTEREAIDAALGAVPNARAYVTDGNAFFNRPGPRLVESLEILAATVHPDAFEDLAAKHADVIRDLRTSADSAQKGHAGDLS